MSPVRWNPRTHSALTVLAIVLISYAVFCLKKKRASATTYASGVILVDTTWGQTDSLYIVTNHVTVAPRVTLTILPKTTVRFQPSMGLFVEGTLVANGQPNSEIIFQSNGTVLSLPWMGVQFNGSSTGSITWSTFERADRAVTAIDSSPFLASNVVRTAGLGFALIRSASMVIGNMILRASSFGIYMNQSTADVEWNSINNTFTGINAEFFGSPNIANNVITNTTGPFAVGIWVQTGAGATLWNNQVLGTRGSAGPNGANPGANGASGGSAVGILVSAAASATVIGNTVDTVLGGRGGNGVENPGATGGRGGDGGTGAGIILSATSTVDLEWSTVRNVYGGRGGNGGGNAVTNVGGFGGNAGPAIRYFVIGAKISSLITQNTASGVSGGVGGNGATSGVSDGNGGLGGDAIALSLGGELGAGVGGRTALPVRGGSG